MNFKVGCHVSIAGGLDKAPARAKELGCETFQIFSRSPQGGPAPKLTNEIVQSFQRSMADCGFSQFVIHAPYYINFGSAEERIFKASVRIVREELERGSLLGATFVMFHPGSVKNNSQGFAQAKRGLWEVLEGFRGSTQLLVEISAGAGEVIGDTFEELAELAAALAKYDTFGGICFDTQHAFASGYDFRTPASARKTFEEAVRWLGRYPFLMSHVNDSKVPFASHKDRHEHLGEGEIGVAGVKSFLAELAKNLPKKGENFPLILETEHDKVAKDIDILKKIRDKLKRG